MNIGTEIISKCIVFRCQITVLEGISAQCVYSSYKLLMTWPSAQGALRCAEGWMATGHGSGLTWGRQLRMAVCSPVFTAKMQRLKECAPVVASLLREQEMSGHRQTDGVIYIYTIVTRAREIRWNKIKLELLRRCQELENVFATPWHKVDIRWWPGIAHFHRAWRMNEDLHLTVRGYSSWAKKMPGMPKL